MRTELKALREALHALTQQQAGLPPAAAQTAGTAPTETPGSSGAPIAASPPDGSFLVPGSGTSLRIYGMAEAHAVHDFRQSSSPDVFTDLSFQPLNKLGSPKGKTQFTAETSRIGFDTSTPMPGGPLQTKIETDFYSYGTDERNRLRLRQAYGTYGNWLIGKTWSTFMDLDDLPETVDFNGPIGAPFSRRTMVRYSIGDAKAGYKFSFAAEDPADQFDGGSTGERTPQLVARVDKEFDWGAINARVMTHTKRSATQTERGYGAAVGGRYKLSSKDTLMAQYTRVDGDIDQLYGSNGYAINPETGRITFDNNQGLVLGYARVFSDSLRGNVAAGFNRGKTTQAIDNRTLRELFVNLIYAPIAKVELGGELIYGRRKTFDASIGSLLRLDLMARYSF